MLTVKETKQDSYKHAGMHNRGSVQTSERSFNNTFMVVMHVTIQSNVMKHKEASPESSVGIRCNIVKFKTWEAYRNKRRQEVPKHIFLALSF